MNDSSPRNIAAVDLGSNSFHMVVARLEDGQVQVIDRIKEMVRLAAGLEDDSTLSEEAQWRALACLRRFGERLRGLDAKDVRVVATDTLRKTGDPKASLARLEEALGHPVEIISGMEEARLVYLGVAHTVEPKAGRRLVIDIGGGSTEFVIGQGFEPLVRGSTSMGCVGYTRRFFPEGVVDARSMERAITAAKQEVELMSTAFRQLGWEEALGSSGTNLAVAQILEQAGWGTGRVTMSGLYRIKERLLRDGLARPSKLPGLSDRRAPVFAAGVAILIAAFEILEIDGLIPSEGALREGALYDLLGRISQRDIRESALEALCVRYSVDMNHAERVEESALSFFEQVKMGWELDSPYLERLLRWAARVHEIGLAITHSDYHKHGSYLVENSDLPGFSRQDQQLLWALVRTHRRSFKPHRFDNAPGHLSLAGMRLAVLLRLAVRLNRSRLAHAVPSLKLSAEEQRLSVKFPDGWLEEMPLTRAVLTEEADYLADAGFELEWD